MDSHHHSRSRLPHPWNKGRVVGQKPPLKPREVWGIRVRLDLADKTRDLAMFNMAIDSKLRGCDLVRLKLGDVAQGSEIRRRATVMQRKTRQPVQFEITKTTRTSLTRWVRERQIRPHQHIFQSRVRASAHLSTRQYARLVGNWVSEIGLDPKSYGTHSLRRTKVTQIYRRTRNLRAVQLLLGHNKLESTVKYLGVELEDALEISEQIDL